MSIIGTLLVSLVAVSALGFTPRAAVRQSGGNPEKIIGPSIVSTSTLRHSLNAKPDAGYTYTVEMSDTSIIDRQVDVYDASGSLLPESPVTVPAGQSSAVFTVYAETPGDDTLTAANANGSASMGVTVY